MSANTQKSQSVIYALWGESGIDEDTVRAYVATNCVFGGPMTENLPTGPEGALAFAQQMRGAFPDVSYETLEQEESDNTVITYLRYHGTQTGQLGPFAPTGNEATVDVTQTDTYNVGMIVKSESAWDPASMFEQLGIDPAQA